MRHLALPFLLLAACGGGGDGAGLPPCPEGTRRASTACVPEAFFEASVPRASAADLAFDEDELAYVRGALWVLARDPATTRAEMEALASANGGRVAGGLPYAGLWLLAFDGTPEVPGLDDLADRLRADPLVEEAERDLLEEGLTSAADRAPSDDEALPPRTGMLRLDPDGTWSADTLGADGLLAWTVPAIPGAWSLVHSANPPLTRVTVAVLDGPVRRLPTFPGDRIRHWEDCRLQESLDEEADLEVHATQVASVLGAPGGDGGMNGVLGGLSCIPYDLASLAVVGHYSLGGLDLQEAATHSNFLAGFVQAVRAGARVLNLSFAFGVSSAWLKIYRRVLAGAPHVLAVAAAGNDGIAAAGLLPAALAIPWKAGEVPNVVAVAATDASDRAAVFEAGGSTNVVGEIPDSVTLAAPGVRVLSTVPDGRLAWFEGTSAAAPLVSGVAGLLFAIDPSLTGAEARAILEGSAAAIGDASVSGRRLDAARAVQRALDRLPAGRLGTGDCRAPDPEPAEDVAEPDDGPGDLPPFDPGPPPPCGTGCEVCFEDSSGPATVRYLVCDEVGPLSSSGDDRCSRKADFTCCDHRMLCGYYVPYCRCCVDDETGERTAECSDKGECWSGSTPCP